MVEMLLSL